MGALALDADVLIGFLNRDDDHHQAAKRLLHAAEQRGDRIVIAASVYAEAILGPLRAGRAHEVDAALAALGIEVVAIDRAVAGEAARLRVRHRALRLPDAMALAVARLTGAELKTFDRRLARIAAG